MGDFQYESGDQPPRHSEIDDILRHLEQKFAGRPGSILWLLLGVFGFILLVVLLMGTFYTVDVQESAIIFRFGKYREDIGLVGPGLHTKIPFIDRVHKAKVEEIKQEEFGYRTIKAGIETQYDVQTSLMLTGDLNVANVRWAVRYKIDDLRSYVINVRKVSDAVRDVSDAVMRRVIGDYSVDAALTIGRQEIQMGAQKEMQELLDQYKVGVKIVSVRLKESTPPDAVRAAFNEVNQSLQEKERTIREAEGQFHREIPAARGEKEKVIREAEGYKVKKINRAKGDVAKFKAVLKQYASAKEVTRRRLYLETMTKALSNAGRKYIVEGDEGVLKLLPLDAVPQMKGGN